MKFHSHEKGCTCQTCYRARAMQRQSTKKYGMSGSSRKVAVARQAVAKAANILRARGTTAATNDMLYTPTNRGGFGPLSRGLPYYRTPELKYLDVQAAQYTFNLTGDFQCLNLPVTGAAFYNRIGNEIEMKSLHMIGNIGLTANTLTGVSEYTRIMILYDRQPNGSFPAVADVLASYSSTGSVSSTSYDHLNPNNSDRFRVLADLRYGFTNNLAATTQCHQAAALDYTNPNIAVNRFINLKGLTTKYKASAGTIGDISSGSLLVFTIGNIAASSEGYNVNLSFRLRFID